jgi:hypothetical protein
LGFFCFVDDDAVEFVDEADDEAEALREND